MIGYFGDIIFETSDNRILNFSGLAYESQSRYGYHRVIGSKPKTEFEGPGLDSMTFTVNLNGNHGVKPREEMEKWIELANNGEAYPLVIGGKVLGEDLWVVKSVSNIWGKVFNNGKLYSGKIDVSLEEYISRL